MAMLSAELISADHICRQEKVSNLDPNAILHRCPFDFKYVVTADARYLDLVVSRECYAKCHNGIAEPEIDADHAGDLDRVTIERMAG